MEVILLFSVNGSGQFQGYAKVLHIPGEYYLPLNTSVWKSDLPKDSLGRTFRVQWLAKFFFFTTLIYYDIVLCDVNAGVKLGSLS